MSEEIADKTAKNYKSGKGSIKPPSDLDDPSKAKALKKRNIKIDIMFIVSIIGSLVCIFLMVAATNWSVENILPGVFALVFLVLLGVMLVIRTQRKLE